MSVLQQHLLCALGACWVHYHVEWFGSSGQTAVRLHGSAGRMASVDRASHGLCGYGMPADRQSSCGWCIIIMLPINCGWCMSVLHGYSTIVFEPLCVGTGGGAASCVEHCNAAARCACAANACSLPPLLPPILTLCLHMLLLLLSPLQHPRALQRHGAQPQQQPGPAAHRHRHQPRSRAAPGRQGGHPAAQPDARQLGWG